MKRYSSAPCLTDEKSEAKRTKPADDSRGPNVKEYLQLALARVLELQREIKEGTYAVNLGGNTSDFSDTSSEEDVTKVVLSDVFGDLPGTTTEIKRAIRRASQSKSHPNLESINVKKIQLLGFDTCRRTALDFIKSSVRDVKITYDPLDRETNDLDFRRGTHSSNEPEIVCRKTGSTRETPRPRWQSPSSSDCELRSRMLRRLDIHLAAKQRDYTVQLMKS